MQPEKEKEQKTAPKISTSAKSLRTYQGDVEEAVAKNKFSSSTIYVAEQKKKIVEQIKNPEPPKPPKDYTIRNEVFITAGIVLLFLGAVTVGTMFYLKSRNQVVVEQRKNTLISYSEEKIMPTRNSNGEGLVQNFLAEKLAFKLPQNSILYINTVSASSTPMEVGKVLALIAPQMPSSLVRSLGKEYMIGIYSSDTNEPFIILTTKDFASSFSGMLKWEKKMGVDFGKLFSLPEYTDSITPDFKDEALQNKDLRILQDVNSKTVLLYSFIDKNTLVITTNENIFSAVVSKYNISKQIR